MFLFGDRLVSLRKEKRISQRELSKETGISSSLIAMYEIGKRTPGSDKIAALADYFDVTTDYLLGKSDYKKGRIVTVAELKEFIPAETIENKNIIIVVDDQPLSLSEKTKEDIKRILKDHGIIKP